jgi:hypothetical protein
LLSWFLSNLLKATATGRIGLGLEHAIGFFRKNKGFEFRRVFLPDSVMARARQ